MKINKILTFATLAATLLRAKTAAPALVLAAIAALAAISASAEQPENKVVRHSAFITSIPAADPAYNQSGALANGDPPLAGSTLVYENNAGSCDHNYPITAPNGRQVTLAEWQEVKGEGHAKCGEGGVQFRLKLKGLIPGGLYTIWLATFKAPGLTPDYSAWVGLGALGLPDGRQNSFVPSADGKAELSVFHPGGALSAFGAFPDCLFGQAGGDEITEVVLWLGLHLDRQTYGGVPHPADKPCTVAFPGAFVFKK